MLSDIARYILEELLRPVFYHLAHFLCGILCHLTHFLGSLLIASVTFGAAKCDSLNLNTTLRSRRRTYGRLGIYRRHGRGIAFSDSFTALIGTLALVGVFVCLYFSHGPSSQPMLPASSP